MKLKYMFDLKGSLINREVKINMKKHKPGMTLKDINLLTIRKGENILKLGLEDRATIMEIIEKDVGILRKQNIMDYSLLLAVENNQLYVGKQGSSTKESSGRGAGSVTSLDTPKFNQLSEPTQPENNRDKMSSMKSSPQMGYNRNVAFFDPTRHRFISNSGEYIYHIAIIDYLQEYNFDKKSEHIIKSIFRGKGSEISAVPPTRYMKRFIEFMGNEVIIDDRNKDSKSYLSL